jgi:uncharacterized protein (TIGR00369 family)
MMTEGITRSDGAYTATTSRKSDMLTGLQIVDAIGTGRIAPPPMIGVIPVTLHAWSEGQVELRALPETRFYNHMGMVHGGWSMTVLDTVMGIAALTTLAAGESCPSLDTAVKFVRPISVQLGELRVFGTILSKGRSVITVDSRIEDEAGKLYAHGSSSCLITPAAKQ